MPKIQAKKANLCRRHLRVETREVLLGVGQAAVREVRRLDADVDGRLDAPEGGLHREVPRLGLRAGLCWL